MQEQFTQQLLHFVTVPPGHAIKYEISNSFHGKMGNIGALLTFCLEALSSKRCHHLRLHTEEHQAATNKQQDIQQRTEIIVL